ncbi:DUF4405 domain-containing protein [Blautia sp. An46]|uniref:DUF4405 domain-containing protein n=1 Tax=Blautia sp. An46 TaxID=1965636 RepID=UPI000B3711CD|nr:DUF4405 domain-containing protein [Blautia sp. An46]OUN91241.1 hypothetical protein B5G00_12970 [Blautia sp. An46]
MNRKQQAKIAVDIFMTLCLLFLMPYELIGEAIHEWIGAGMFLLFILHHILNRKWTGNLTKGRYKPLRIIQTILVMLILICILGSMASGIILSRHVFAFLKIRDLSAPARVIHMTCAYWGFVLMSLHLGIHWGMMMGMAGKIFPKPSKARNWILRLAGIGIAGYGIYAFIKRDILSYLLMQVQYVFFNFEEPVIFFILDYMAAMGLFVFIGYYLRKRLARKRQG